VIGLLRNAVIALGVFFVILISAMVRYPPGAPLPASCNLALGCALGVAVIDGTVAAVWAFKRAERGEL
jgi:hypothetical protein